MGYNYQIDLSPIGGRTWHVESEEKAIEEILKDYPRAVISDDWELKGYTQYSNKKMERKMFWENEKEAGKEGVGDDGSHALGEIVRIEV